MSTTGRIRIKILDTCPRCEGIAYLPLADVEDEKGELYTRYITCSMCEGSGLVEKSISLTQFVQLIVSVDVFEPDYSSLAEKEPVTQCSDSLESAGLK